VTRVSVIEAQAVIDGWIVWESPCRRRSINGTVNIASFSWEEGLVPAAFFELQAKGISGDKSLFPTETSPVLKVNFGWRGFVGLR